MLVRLFGAMTGLLVLVVPLDTYAQSISDQEAQNEMVQAQNKAVAIELKQQAKLANDLAQCQIVAGGGTVPGNSVGPCPMGQLSPSMQIGSTPTASGPCVAATRTLTKSELKMVNEFEIAVNLAVANHLAAPMMSSDVSALIGCT